MVIAQRLSEEPDSTVIVEENEDEISEHENEDWSENTSTASQDEGEDKDCALDIVATEESAASFGNIVVKNSSDVHFGNKTFYHGPVTIKQFLYNNTPSDVNLSIENGRTNSSFEPENVPSVTTDGYCNSSANNTKNGLPTSSKSDEEVAEKGPTNFLSHIRHHYKLVSLCSFLLLMFIIVLSVILVTKFEVPGEEEIRKDSSEQENNQPAPGFIDPNNVTLSGKLRIITRGQWVAQPPKNSTDLKTPVPYVIIIHTATDFCYSFANCTFHVRYIQSYHIDSNSWWDIAYNFLVGGDGFAYEGRGWTKEGAFTYGYNSRAIGIAFIGTFNTVLPPSRQILAAKQLIELGVEKGYIAKDYKLFGHRQLSSTQSPGDLLFEDIKTWPHWASKPD